MKTLYQGILYSKYYAKENHIFIFQGKEYRVEGDDFKDWARYQMPYMTGGAYRFHGSVLISGQFEGEAVQVSSVFRGINQVFTIMFDQIEFKEAVLNGNVENCEIGILEYANNESSPRFILPDRTLRVVDDRFIDWLQDKFPDLRHNKFRFRYWSSMEFEESGEEICRVLMLHINLWNDLWYKALI